MSRHPKIRIVPTREQYNILMAALHENSKIDHERIASDAKRLIEKIGRFAVPGINDNGEDSADIRFFEQEAQALLWQYIVSMDDRLCDFTDYYFLLEQETEARLQAEMDAELLKGLEDYNAE